MTHRAALAWRLQHRLDCLGKLAGAPWIYLYSSIASNLGQAGYIAGDHRRTAGQDSQDWQAKALVQRRIDVYFSVAINPTQPGIGHTP